MSAPMYMYVKGKVVGAYYHPEKLYVKKVKHSVHYMRMYNGYGIQAEVLANLRELGCELVGIHEVDTNKRYLSDIGQWTGDEIDHGHGAQVFLPLLEMRIKE